jgi:hypothetical protein
MSPFLKRLAAGLCVASSALLTACGGGSADPSAPDPGVVYQGTISGFGSVIVGGVHFDDSAAQVTVDDAAAGAGALKLGMQAQVSGSVAADGSGVAAAVTVETSLRGPVGSVDAAASRFTVRGISVQTDSETVFEGASGVATLSVGTWVEVHGAVDAARRTVQATRVEVLPPEEAGRLVLFGRATGVTATSFTLGDLTVVYTGARLIGFDGNTILEGAMVRVRANQPPTGNVLTAQVVKALKAPRWIDGTRATVEGRVQQFVSVSDFLVNGTPVDARNATFVFGTAADLSEGKRVIVRGTLANGRIIASQVRFFRPDQDGEVRLIGLVSDFVSIASFRVRGVAVDASAAVFENGSAADLVNGRLVDVRGESAGNVVRATRIRFGDALATSGWITGVISDFVSPEQFKLGGRNARLAGGARLIGGTAADLGNGVTLWAQGSVDANGVFVIVRAIFPPRWAIATTQVAGTVTDPAADGSSFTINGTRVTTSERTRYPNGSVDRIVAGAWVIVIGRFSSGTLVADTIVFAERAGQEQCRAFKIEGVVYDFVSPANFKLFGFSVDASAATFVGGSMADLADGRVIEVCGNRLPTGATLVATRVEFKSAR